MELTGASRSCFVLSLPDQLELAGFGPTDRILVVPGWGLTLTRVLPETPVGQPILMSCCIFPGVINQPVLVQRAQKSVDRNHAPLRIGCTRANRRCGIDGNFSATQPPLKKVALLGYVEELNI